MSDLTLPIVKRGADPWVVRDDGAYHLVQSSDTDPGVCVSSATSLAGLADAEPVMVWRPDSAHYGSEIWAPEIHYLDGRWFLYVAADDGKNANHRMYVLEGGQRAYAPYRMVGVISTPDDHWAIDGTILDHPTKGRYFIWSGWESDVNIRQVLYIAAMTDPVTLAGDRHMISIPDLPWERRGGPPYINEGPACLILGEHVWCVYSASGSWTDHYCLGALNIPLDADPLEPASWVKTPEPVFRGVPGAHGPGHCSFGFSSDGSERWIYYHANSVPGTGWAGRSIRAQRFMVGADGVPDFGMPFAAGSALAPPSGE